MTMNTFNTPAKLVLTGNLSENWRKFRQSFEIYILAGGLDVATDKRKIAILLNVIGEDAVTLYNTFKINEKTEKEITLEHVLNDFEKYCNPKKNILYSRYQFYNRKQKEGETFDTFLTETQTLIKDCEFCTSCQDNLLRDKLILGTINEEQQKKLIKSGDPTLEDVVSALRVAEITNEQIKDVQQKCVLTVSKRTCSFCGFTHEPRKCPAYNKTCAKCQRKNHFAKMCKAKINVNEANINETDVNEYYCGAVTINKFSIESIGWLKEIVVENTKIVFKLDPGADVSIISYEKFMQIKKNATQPIYLKKSSAVLESWNGFKTPVEGTASLKISFNNNEINEIFFVAGKENSTSILSREACVKLNLVKLVNEITNADSKEAIYNQNKDIFSGIGKVEKPYDIRIKKDIIPSSKPPYRVPLKLRPKLQAELRKLLQLGIISEVNEPSEWVNRLAIVEKPDGSIRLCLDPQELNKAIIRDYCTTPTYLQDYC